MYTYAFNLTAVEAKYIYNRVRERELEQIAAVIFYRGRLF